MPGAYDSKRIEQEILEFWNSEKIFEKCALKNKGKRRFYFIDGPPYTSGAIHIGHAWNKSLKDAILRYKRMRGFDAWSQPGFDMHGLPIEVAVEKKLGIKDKKEIVEKLGVERFVQECQKFSIEQMHPMIKDFSRLGVWMDWNNPYMTIKNEYIEGAWWALSRSDKNGYLYEGKKSMTWCPRCATALAKHELTYKDATDTSIFVKFPIKGQKDSFLIIWTTTPWTIPFNLAVMVHPEFDYITAQVHETGEYWVIAKALANKVITETCGYKYTVKDEKKGAELDGMKYITPFLSEIEFQGRVDSIKAHTVVLSQQYVELSSGTGLVHTAPGCGPEDFEIGKKNGLPAFNTLDETGKFTEAGVYDGLHAKKDDNAFIKHLEKKGLLAATVPFSHEYPHCWRCETPVIYRSTSQWFLAVEKLKEDMLNENERVAWVPEWAGSRWFSSWLENLQDWCISRQRFWGIPLPIWKCTKCTEKRIIGSSKELPMQPENLHRPWIDEIEFTCNCGSPMKRVPDVLDVWLDSGAASWAPLNYPAEDGLFENMWPADFILEGKDQIRGWFNSMMCLSMVSHQRNCYKAVYMHGFVNDALGRKMSKSLKNTISPYEVIDNYGADTLRYYSIGGAKPGFDLNYNFEDMKIKHKNLTVFWNIANFLLELSETASLDGDKELSIDERYILSKLHSTTEKATQMFENYYINEVPWIIEDLLLELSRTYMQITREKASGTPEERNTVLHTVYTVYLEALKMLSPIAPFITEKIYQELKQKFDFENESIHMHEWPEPDKKMINDRLEKDFETAKAAIQAMLAIRERARAGIRWPLSKAIIVTNELESEDVKEAIKRQANIKDLSIQSEFKGSKATIRADYEKLKPKFGSKSTQIIAALAMTSPETILKYIEREGQFILNMDDQRIELPQECFIIAKQPPHGYEYESFEKGEVYLNIIPTPDLEAEGYSRELARRIQSMRKTAGLKKSQHISIHVKASEKLIEPISRFLMPMKDKLGATKLEITSQPATDFNTSKKERIRENEFEISLKLTNSDI
ncbi:isoleucine--tRNA ligase [Candidatus Woesearchaeota archaeon]|nr:isoleucine--tRNA ligase [Candidatus Woesearchaeota archaeon]